MQQLTKPGEKRLNLKVRKLALLAWSLCEPLNCTKQFSQFRGKEAGKEMGRQRRAFWTETRGSKAVERMTRVQNI